MRLNFGRRLVLFVHWLLSLAGCALAVTLILWPTCMQTAQALLERHGLALKIYAIAVLVVYLIFAVGAVCIILGGRKRSDKNAFIVVDSSETGRTRIAVGAVDQMIRQAVRGVDGIVEMRSSIVNNEDSIAIAADVVIRNGTHVPTVTANIQRAIRGYIEHNCGVSVHGVNVSVHSLADAEETGRRGRKKKSEVSSYVNPTPVGNANPNYEPIESPAAPDYAAPIPAPSYEPPVPQTASCTVESEPIRLTFDPLPEEPADEPELASAEEPVVEAAPAEGPAAEAEPTEFGSEPTAPEPVAEPEPAPKKGFFGRIFGKRGRSEGKPEEKPAPENLETPAEPVAEPENSETPIEAITEPENSETPAEPIEGSNGES